MSRSYATNEREFSVPPPTAAATSAQTTVTLRPHYSISATTTTRPISSTTPLQRHYSTLPASSLVNSPVSSVTGAPILPGYTSSPYTNNNHFTERVGGGGIYHSVRMSSPAFGNGTLGRRVGGGGGGGPIGGDSVSILSEEHFNFSKGFVPCIVTMLDGSEHTFEVKRQARGQELFDSICNSLDLQEREYFGVTFRGPDNVWSWLQLEKRMNKYLTNAPWRFEFQVKFYPPEPSKLRDDLTRYLLCLQIRQDLVCKKLPCSFITFVLLSAYVVQSEIGDHIDNLHPGLDYLKEMLLAPEGIQTPELLSRVVDLHKQLKGLRPDEADLRFLENAKKLALYGVDFHKAKDASGEDLMLGVCHAGVYVYIGRLRINRFFWPKIVKITFLRSLFKMFLRSVEGDGPLKYVEFRCQNPKQAKRLWKTCVEHHTFFRLRHNQDPLKRPTLLPAFTQRHFRTSGFTPTSGVGTLYDSERCRPTTSIDDTDNDNLDNRRQPQFIRQPAYRHSMLVRNYAHVTPTVGPSRLSAPIPSGSTADQSTATHWTQTDTSTTAAPTTTMEPMDNSLLTTEAPLTVRVITSPALRQPNDGLSSRIIRPARPQSTHFTPDKAVVLQTTQQAPSVVVPLANLPSHSMPPATAAPLPPPPPSALTTAAAIHHQQHQTPRPVLPGPEWRVSHVDISPGLVLETNEGLAVGTSLGGYETPLPPMTQGSPGLGCRSTWGVSQSGKYYYEVTVMGGHGPLRVGWSTNDSSLVVGEDRGSFGYGSPIFTPNRSGNNNVSISDVDRCSVKVNAGLMSIVGDPISPGDVIGCFLDLNQGIIRFSRNGHDIPDECVIPAVLRRDAYFPAATMMQNISLLFNFGASSFVFSSKSGGGDWLPVCRAPRHTLVANSNEGWRLNEHDSSDGLDMGVDGQVVQARSDRGWQGCRANRGVRGAGRYYYEASIVELNVDAGAGAVIGWSSEDASLRLGNDKIGIGYGTIPNADPSSRYGLVTADANIAMKKEPKTMLGMIQVGDVVGCCIDLDTWVMQWFVNSQPVCSPVTIKPALRAQAFFPTVSIKDATVALNFGNSPFRYTPPPGYIAVGSARQEVIRTAKRKGLDKRVKGGWSYVDSGTLENSLRLRNQRLSQLAEEPSPATTPTATSSNKPIVVATSTTSAAAAGRPPAPPTYATLQQQRNSTSLKSSPSSTVGENGSTVNATNTAAATTTTTTSGTQHEKVYQTPQSILSPSSPTKVAQLVKIGGGGTAPSSSSNSTPSTTTFSQYNTEYTSVERGEPIIECESYIAEDGSRVTRTIKRTRILTKVAATSTVCPNSTTPTSSPLLLEEICPNVAVNIPTVATRTLQMTHSNSAQSPSITTTTHPPIVPTIGTSAAAAAAAAQHVSSPTMCGGCTGTCGEPCRQGIPTVVTKTAYFCYHPRENESNEEAVARLAQTIQQQQQHVEDNLEEQHKARHAELMEVTVYQTRAGAATESNSFLQNMPMSRQHLEPSSSGISSGES